MFSFFKKRPKTPEPGATETKDEFEVINRTTPPTIPFESNGIYGQSYPVLPQPDTTGPQQLRRYESVSKPTQTTEGVPFKLSKQVGRDMFVDKLKSQIDDLARTFDQKISNNSSMGYSFQVEKSVISEC